MKLGLTIDTRYVPGLETFHVSHINSIGVTSSVAGLCWLPVERVMAAP